MIWNVHGHDLYLLISWLAARHSSSNECFLFEPDAANWLATALEWLVVPTPVVAPAEAPRPILAKTADDWSEDLLCPGDTAEPVDKAQVWQLISCHNSIIGKSLNNFVEILKTRQKRFAKHTAVQSYRLRLFVIVCGERVWSSKVILRATAVSCQQRRTAVKTFQNAC